MKTRARCVLWADALLGELTTADNPGSLMDMREAQAAARTLGLMVTTSEIRQAEDIAPAFETLKGRADAIYVSPDPPVNTNRTRINILAVGARLPTMNASREYVEAGGLISYGLSKGTISTSCTGSPTATLSDCLRLHKSWSNSVPA